MEKGKSESKVEKSSHASNQTATQDQGAHPTLELWDVMQTSAVQVTQCLRTMYGTEPDESGIILHKLWTKEGLQAKQ